MELCAFTHKLKFSCESTIYFDLSPTCIMKNCTFYYYIKPSMLDVGNEIILANWPNEKHIEGNKNSDIPVKMPSSPYVPFDSSVLGNCNNEAETIFFWNCGCFS